MGAAVPAARQLAEWALACDRPPLVVRRAAVRHLGDGIGTALAASRTGEAGPALAVAAALGGPPQATLPGTATRVDAAAAALACGALVHAHDFDDTHAGGLVHATAVVLPAALAVGEQVAATGAEVVAAAVVGYEVACRLAAAVPHAFHARGLHATAVVGPLASAVVAARLLGLDADRTTAALGIAASTSGGLLEFLGTPASTKQLHPGLAGHAGILAARLAAAGASGPDTVLEGRRGLYRALAATDPDLGVLLGGLGERWETVRIGVKPYPSCQLMHASLDAARDAAARAGAGWRPDAVEEVLVRVHPDSAGVVCEEGRDLAHPASGYDAKFSLPWSVAAMLVDGQVGLDTYSDESLARPEVAALAARVRWESAPAAGGPVAADAPGWVRLRGPGLDAVGEVARSGGGPDDPGTPAAVRSKFLANGGGTAEAADLLALVDDLEDVAGVGELWRRYRLAVAAAPQTAAPQTAAPQTAAPQAPEPFTAESRPEPTRS